MFDWDRRLVTRAGRPVALTRRAFLLLELLVRHRPGVVTKQEILDQLWPDSNVDEGSVASLVSELRAALGPDGRTAIRTAHGFGYAYSAPAEVEDASPSAPVLFLLIEAGSPPRTISRASEATLVGRDLDCDVRLASSTVSRRHARIRWKAGTATLEDLHSRNGTYLDGEKIERPVPLRDGQCIRFGSVELVFRSAATAAGETESMSGA